MLPGGIGGPVFGFAAGALSILSPCVLPLVPLVLAGAASAHRWGMAALAVGLVVSFVAIGLFVATIGFSAGLGGEVFRALAALVLALVGCVLLSGILQTRLSVAMAGVEATASRYADRLTQSGLGGQFLMGVLLGAIWSPCVGPTLGAASVLAAQGRDLGRVALVMAAFGLGTALPLLLIGSASRTTWRRWQGRVRGAGRIGRPLLGATALVVALAILTGTDHSIEADLVAASPAWLTRLTTQF